jgi:hypothetical protein
VLFYIADEWTWRRHVLTLLGGEEDRPLDGALGHGMRLGERLARDRSSARRELAEELGGEVVQLEQWRGRG